MNVTLNTTGIVETDYDSIMVLDLNVRSTLG
jgi:hypothetical protein